MVELELGTLLIGEVRSFGQGPKYLVIGPPHDPSLNGTHLRVGVLGEDTAFDYPLASIETDPHAS